MEREDSLVIRIVEQRSRVETGTRTGYGHPSMTRRTRPPGWTSAVPGCTAVPRSPDRVTACCGLHGARLPDRQDRPAVASNDRNSVSAKKKNPMTAVTDGAGLLREGLSKTQRHSSAKTPDRRRTRTRAVKGPASELRHRQVLVRQGPAERPGEHHRLPDHRAVASWLMSMKVEPMGIDRAEAR